MIAFWLPAAGAEAKYLALACILGAATLQWWSAVLSCKGWGQQGGELPSSVLLGAVISSAVNQTGQSDKNIPLVLLSVVFSKMVGISMDEIWLLAAIYCCCSRDTKGEEGLPSNNDAFR